MDAMVRPMMIAYFRISLGNYRDVVRVKCMEYFLCNLTFIYSILNYLISIIIGMSWSYS
jgi:hypothetical protein